MARPVLYGAAYSAYVRIVRLALAEKQVDYDLVEVDIFAPGGPPGWYAQLHPFGKIPAFEHGALRLFETQAICRYVDEAFEGPALQPPLPADRAVMAEIVGMLDAYAYRTLVWDIYVERVSKPRDGRTPDEERIALALPRARHILDVLGALKRPGSWLLGDRLTLADLHAAPMLAYFVQSPEGAAMLTDTPSLSTWYGVLSARTSFRGTEPTA
ncbi:MAG: glutathione S-transferase family protein [Pseudomonadota bacterium]